VSSGRTALAWLGGAALLALPLALPQFYVLLSTEILIMALFAIAFNVLLGYGGMVSFGHAAFYGLGAYACGLLLKKADAPFALAFLAAPVAAAAAALLFGALCIRLTRIYFSRLTLAFDRAQVVQPHGRRQRARRHPGPRAARGPAGLLPVRGRVGRARDVGALAARERAVRPDAARDPGERRARRVRGDPRPPRPAHRLRRVGRGVIGRASCRERV
jgi:hypothetical protein